MDKGGGFRLRAAKIRQRANQNLDTKSRDELLQLADSYDRLAAQVEGVTLQKFHSSDGTGERATS